MRFENLVVARLGDGKWWCRNEDDMAVIQTLDAQDMLNFFGERGFELVAVMLDDTTPSCNYFLKRQVER